MSKLITMQADKRKPDAVIRLQLKYSMSFAVLV